MLSLRYQHESVISFTAEEITQRINVPLNYEQENMRMQYIGPKYTSKRDLATHKKKRKGPFLF